MRRFAAAAQNSILLFRSLVTRRPSCVSGNFRYHFAYSISVRRRTQCFRFRRTQQVRPFSFYFFALRFFHRVVWMLNNFEFKSNTHFWILYSSFASIMIMNYYVQSQKTTERKKNARIVENEATENCLDVRFTFNCGEFLYIFLIACYSPARWNFFSLSHAYKFRSGRCVGPCCGCCWCCWCRFWMAEIGEIW